MVPSVTSVNNQSETFGVLFSEKVGGKENKIILISAVFVILL